MHFLNKTKELVSKINPLKDTVLVIMIILLITKVLGLLKVRIFADLFGASESLDIFWAAFTIPDTIFNVLIAGSINAAIIPVFSDVLHKKGKLEFRDLFWKVSLLYSGILILLSVIMLFSAQSIASSLVYSPTLNNLLGIQRTVSAQGQLVLADLIAIMMLSPIFLALSNFVTAFLQTQKKFFYTSLAPLMYNLVTIVVAMVAVRYLGGGIYELAWAIVLSSLAHLLIQIPEFIKEYKEDYQGVQIRWRLILDGFFSLEIIKLLKLALPRVLGMLGEYFNVMFNTMLSFTINSGGVLSAYRFAVSLYQFPIHIVVSSVTQVALPHLAESYVKNEKEKFMKIFNKSLGMMLYLLLPITAVIFILRLPIVRLVLGVGEFDWWDTVITSWCLAMLSLSIVPQAVTSIMFRAFYAMHETWLPLLATVFGVLINIPLGYLLTNFFSHYFDWRPILGQIGTQVEASGTANLLPVLWSFITDSLSWMLNRGDSDAAIGGLALAFSITLLIEMILLAWLLNRRIKVVTWIYTVKPFMIKLLNTFLMAFAMYFVFRLADLSLDTSRTMNVALVSGLTATYGMIVYVLGSRVLRIKEYEEVQEKVLRIIGPLLGRFIHR